MKRWQVYCAGCVSSTLWPTEEMALRKAETLTYLSGHKWYVREVLIRA